MEGIAWADKDVRDVQQNFAYNSLSVYGEDRDLLFCGVAGVFQFSGKTA